MPEDQNTQSEFECRKTSAMCNITIYKTVDGFMWNEYSFHGLICETYVAQLIATEPLYLLHDGDGESLIDDLAEPLLEAVQHLRDGGTLGTEIGFKGNT